MTLTESDRLSPEAREALAFEALLIELRAARAKAEEDFRIARKHADIAGAREMTPSNARAYDSAREWERICLREMETARGDVIRALASDTAARLARVSS